jgi:hypothetical protein
VSVIAEQWANEKHDDDVKDAAAAFTTPEESSVKQYATGGEYWALKKNVPTVQISNRMANQLRLMYNEQNPHVSPEGAAVGLLALPEYHQSLYAKHVITADKIKVFFGGLKKKKVNGVVPELHRQAGCNGYKSFVTAPAMKAEYQRRLELGHITRPKPMPSKKEHWAVMLELNDLQRANTITDHEEENQHGEDAQKACEEGIGDCTQGFQTSEGDEDTTMEEALGQHDLLGDDTPE